jgi:hypothetical protein
MDIIYVTGKDAELLEAQQESQRIAAEDAFAKQGAKSFEGAVVDADTPTSFVRGD